MGFSYIIPLNNFPISRNCWRMLWSDSDTGRPAQSRYAYAAALANLGKIRPDGSWQESWDEPWIAYFNLTQPDKIEPRQMKTWWSVYGLSEDASHDFGRRVLDMQPHAVWTKRGWEERWLSYLGTASSNLWCYVTSNGKSKARLEGAPVASALWLIRVLAVTELLPAWCFLKYSGAQWLQHWPVVAGLPKERWPFPAEQIDDCVADEWAHLAKAIVGHKAGWVAMLSSLKPWKDNNAHLALLRSWLFYCRTAGITTLRGQDPEDFLQRLCHLPSSKDFGWHREFARKNANDVLKLLDDPQERTMLTKFVDQISDIS